MGARSPQGRDVGQIKAVRRGGEARDGKKETFWFKARRARTNEVWTVERQEIEQVLSPRMSEGSPEAMKHTSQSGKLRLERRCEMLMANEQQRPCSLLSGSASFCTKIVEPR